MRGGLRVLLGGLSRNRRPDIVKHNVRLCCTKCVLTLRTRLANRVLRGAPVMRIMTTKALLVCESIGRSCAGIPVSLQGQGPSTVGAYYHAEESQVDDVAPRGRRRPQSAETDWLITSTQPGGPIDARLIPSHEGHIAKVIFEGSERTPPILECRTRKKSLEATIRLQDMSNELYGVLTATPLGRLPYIMHQHIDSALITAFVERWQPVTNTFHMPWGEMTIMLHDVQRILGIGIEGSLPAEPSDGEWKLALAGLLGEPMSKLRRNGYFTKGSINVCEIMHMCHRSQCLDIS